MMAEERRGCFEEFGCFDGIAQHRFQSPAPIDALALISRWSVGECTLSYPRPPMFDGVVGKSRRVKY